MRKITKKDVKNLFQNIDVAVNDTHLEQTATKAFEILNEKKKVKHINFGTFLKSQINFIGIKIWLIQCIVLIFVYLIFEKMAKYFFIDNLKNITFILSCISIIILFMAIPFIERSIRFKMFETELATHFSINKLITARLIIIGTGNIIMLAVMIFFASIQIPLYLYNSILYITLPYLVACYGLLYILSHVKCEKFYIASTIFCLSLFLILALLNKFFPLFFLQTFSANWIALYIILLIMCAIQFIRISHCVKYISIQTI